jgi:hypothetical protein
VTRKPAQAASKDSPGVMSLLGPVLKLAAASAAGRAIKDAASEASTRLLFTMAAGVAGAVGVFCFSRAGLEVLERYMNAADAWACIGAFYAVIGGLFYYASTRRRRRNSSL